MLYFMHFMLPLACILCLCVATLTEGFPCFFLSCKANARVKPAKTGYGPHSSKFSCCSIYCLFCVVLCTVCVYMCTVLLPLGGYPIAVNKYRMFNLKVDCILIWVIYLLRFTTCYITQLTCIYSKCWKWCPFISMHLSTRFTMFPATFISVLSFFNHFRKSTFYWRLPSKFFKETLSTVGVRHRF